MHGSSLALLQDLKSPHFDEVVAYIYMYMERSIDRYAALMSSGPRFGFHSVRMSPCQKLKAEPRF